MSADLSAGLIPTGSEKGATEGSAAGIRKIERKKCGNKKCW